MGPLRIVAALALTGAVVGGCSTGEGDPEDAGMDGGTIPADAGLPDVGPRLDAPGVDRFVPPVDASCGRAVIPTQRIPGSLLFVYDRSGSMDAPVVSGGAGPTRWTIAGDAVRSVLSAIDDEVRVGMLLFPPAGEMCNVTLGAGVPQVPVAPLATSRAAVEAELARIPDGPATPTFAALDAGWDHLDTLDDRGATALVLVTDGRENCEGPRDAAFTRARSEREADGPLTFVIGLTQSDQDLSTLALEGGTARNATCVAECTTQDCQIDADEPCANGAACTSFPEGESGGRVPGFCGCFTDADCPDPTTCTADLGGGLLACEGAPNCCHYVAGAATFDADFRAALEVVTERIVDACVFDLPRGDDPELFDPDLVNVRAIFDDGEELEIPRSSDPALDAWDFTDDAERAIEIRGALCERLRAEPAEVEIHLGCPTTLI